MTLTYASVLDLISKLPPRPERGSFLMNDAAAFALLPLKRAQDQGPCLMCGNLDNRASARHRLWDAIDGAMRMDGWSDEQCATEWRMDTDECRWIRQAFARARKAHRPLPGRRIFA